MTPLDLSVGKTDAVKIVADLIGMGSVNPWADDVDQLIERFGDGPSNRGHHFNFVNSPEIELQDRQFFPAIDHKMSPVVHLTGEPECFEGIRSEYLHTPSVNVLDVKGGIICHFSEMPVIFDSNYKSIIKNYSSKYAGITKFYSFSEEDIFSNVRYIDGTLLVLIDDISPPNFCHWLVDMIPRLAVMSHRLKDNDFFVATRVLSSPYQYEALEMCGISRDRIIELAPYESVQAKHLVVTSDINNMPHPCFKSAPWALDFLKSKILVNSLSSENIRPIGSRKLYISRNDAPGRKIINDSDFYDYLQYHGYEKIILGDLSLTEQVKYFSMASHVVALHGAGLSHIALLSGECSTIEIFPNSYGTPAFYILSAAQGNPYYTYVANDVKKGDRPQIDNLYIDIQKFDKLASHLI